MVQGRGLGRSGVKGGDVAGGEGEGRRSWALGTRGAYHSRSFPRSCGHAHDTALGTIVASWIDWIIPPFHSALEHSLDARTPSHDH